MYCCLWRSSRILFASRKNSANTSKVLHRSTWLLFIVSKWFRCLEMLYNSISRFAIVHVYVLINCFSENKFEMSTDFLATKY